MSNLGGGAPDLLVRRQGDFWLMELKDGNLPPSKRRLTPDEKAFHDEWQCGRLVIVGSIEEAFKAVGL